MDPNTATHVFQEWLKAELILRCLTHSSTTVCLEEDRIFYDHLLPRGYPVKAINSGLKPAPLESDDSFVKIADESFLTETYLEKIRQRA